MAKRRQKSPLPGYQSGIAGEYFVAAELSRMGYVASLTLKNTAGIDILASKVKVTRTVAIQVKTSQGAKPVFTLGVKAEKAEAAKLYYVFVNLGDHDSSPEYYIVSSNVVARQVQRSHAEWLLKPGKHGRKHKDNPLRNFHAPRNCRNGWGRLKLGTP